MIELGTTLDAWTKRMESHAKPEVAPPAAVPAGQPAPVAAGGAR